MAMVDLYMAQILPSVGMHLRVCVRDNVIACCCRIAARSRTCLSTADHY